MRHIISREISDGLVEGVHVEIGVRLFEVECGTESDGVVTTGTLVNTVALQLEKHGITIHDDSRLIVSLHRRWPQTEK